MSIETPEASVDDEARAEYAAGFRLRMDTLAEAINSGNPAQIHEAELEVERHMQQSPMLAAIYERANRDRDYQA